MRHNMSTKPRKSVKSPRRQPRGPTRSPPRSPSRAKPQKKKRIVQNVYDLVQFKRMLGKGLILPCKDNTAVLDPAIKEQIMAKSVKSIAMSGMIMSGIVYIFDGVDRLLAINSVSYADIKKNNLEIDIIINQHI
jgi:hypothetical protein